MKNDKELAINGGSPVTTQTVVIHKPYLDERDYSAVDRTLRSTFISGNGPQCMEFEKKLAAYLGVKHVLYTNSCTTALDLAFRVKDYPAGSEVIVPNFTYTSTALGPLLNNLKVRLVDVDPLNGNIDVNKIKPLINEMTVAIAPVDYAGNPADLEPIMALARDHGLYVVHDAAQSIGSIYKGKKTGTLADIACFSFHGTKNLTTGEGGAIATNNDELAKRLIFMREKGTDKQSFLIDNRTRGLELDRGFLIIKHSALGSAQLEKIDWMNEERRKIAEFYKIELAGIPGLDFLKITPDSKPNWHIFGILVPAEHKYWIMDAIRAEGIIANVHYTPLHKNKFYLGYADDVEMHGSMSFFGRLLRLPIYPSLTQKEREVWSKR